MLQRIPLLQSRTAESMHPGRVADLTQNNRRLKEISKQMQI